MASKKNLSFGLFSIQLVVKSAQIQQAEVYSDSLNIDIIDKIKSCLTFSPYSAQAMQSIFYPITQEFPEEALEISSWLSNELQ
ncbi:lipoate protein ligase C-terminal domain-containing protein [Piscirickettsia litoralis]|uniref:lipoate protein ligase C-terminal domain-containing protein n=1 Tax=Piscirickettsia litoralis TaxID=1891921 RepID=UPI001112FA0C